MTNECVSAGPLSLPSNDQQFYRDALEKSPSPRHRSDSRSHTRHLRTCFDSIRSARARTHRKMQMAQSARDDAASPNTSPSILVVSLLCLVMIVWCAIVNITRRATNANDAKIFITIDRGLGQRNVTRTNVSVRSLASHFVSSSEDYTLLHQ